VSDIDDRPDTTRAPRSRREANKRDKRQRIEAAARQLFATHGFEGTTTRAIAERADVAAGTVFRYAPSKRALLRGLWREDIERTVGDALDTGDPDAPLSTWLSSVFSTFIHFYLEDARLSRVYLREIVFPAPDDAPGDPSGEVTEDFLVQIAQRVAAAQARDEVDADVEPLQVAHFAFTTYIGALIGALNGTLPPASVDEHLARSFARLLDGFRPGAGHQGGAPCTPAR
jgi:AcrR family transcriptional regulator